MGNALPKSSPAETRALHVSMQNSLTVSDRTLSTEEILGKGVSIRNGQDLSVVRAASGADGKMRAEGILATEASSGSYQQTGDRWTKGRQRVTL